PVEVVVHGVDPPQVVTGPAARPAARDRLGLDPDAPVVGTVGNFTPKKDQATLLRAVAALAGDAAPTLVLVGLGPLEGELRALAGELGIERRVVFAGSRDDVFELLPGFDAFVLSSRFEGLPIALLEAMATGVAPVATPVGGIPEVITDGVDGLLVPPGDPDALATALGKVLRDDALRADLGARARERARAFDLVHAVRRTEAIYRLALGRPAPGDEPAGAGPRPPPAGPARYPSSTTTATTCPKVSSLPAGAALNPMCSVVPSGATAML